jgi:hypothetical protein
LRAQIIDHVTNTDSGRQANNGFPQQTLQLRDSR